MKEMMKLKKKHALFFAIKWFIYCLLTFAVLASARTIPLIVKVKSMLAIYAVMVLYYWTPLFDLSYMQQDAK